MSAEPVPLARTALGVALALNSGLRAQLADAQVAADARARGAYFDGRAEGYKEGRRGRGKLLVAGVLAGWLSALGVFAFVLALA